MKHKSATHRLRLHLPSMKTNAIARRFNRRTALQLLLPALLLGVVVYRVKFAPVPVTAYEVKAAPITGEVMGTGTLEARVKTTISSRLQERLVEVLVDQNDFVRAGQLLARLDEGELQPQVEVASATLSAAHATAERVRVDEARAQAVEKQARLEHQRVSGLLLNGVASQAALDKATEQWQVATADLKRAQAAIREAERQVITAEKTLAYQQERLSYTRILSPYNGLVVRRDRDPGGVVVPGSSILQLISTNELWVSAWVDETAMAGLEAGQPARVVFRSEPAKSYPGAVARLGRETDRETREFLVDVRLQELPKIWTLGQRAEVFIGVGRKAAALTVPQRFVQWREGQASVLVSEHGKALRRRVKPGLSGRDMLEIEQGLSAGDLVVQVENPKRPALADGQRITLP